MSERIIDIAPHNPLDLFGVSDKYLELIRGYFPKLRVVARGNMVKAIGSEDQLDLFEGKFSLLLANYEHFGRITERDIDQIMGAEEPSMVESSLGTPETLLHGRSGLLIRPRTENQKRLVDSAMVNDLVFAIGPAGTGKTYTAVALAVRALKNREVKRIILTRPAVEAGENLGFLPGDFREKLDPYMQPLYDALRDMIPTQKLLTYLEDGTIEIVPLAFMRGRTIDNAYAILDEAQNATELQMKMFITRMGRSSRFIVTGDITQIDLPARQMSGLKQAEKLLKGIPGIDFIYLDESDVIRHRLVTRIIRAYNNINHHSNHQA
ncbi:MAG: PhoH family protein [Bacteroidales bacterium]|nr:PhoH family protein [Bacteroidales bacterium]